MLQASGLTIEGEQFRCAQQAGAQFRVDGHIAQRRFPVIVAVQGQGRADAAMVDAQDDDGFTQDHPTVPLTGAGSGIDIAGMGGQQAQDFLPFPSAGHHFFHFCFQGIFVGRIELAGHCRSSRHLSSCLPLAIDDPPVVDSPFA